MTVTFFTSVLNHHQLPFCLEMWKALGNDFTVVTTMELEPQRIILGYKDYSRDYNFCLKMNISEENEKKAYKLSQECDTLIAGVIPEEYIYDRLKKNNLTFRYSERFFKEGFWRILSPRALYMAYRSHFRYRNRDFYLLCASSYAAKDASLMFSYPGKMYKWGYFPEFNELNINETLEQKYRDKIHILWVGRFINWKQPEHAIQVAKYLKSRNHEYILEFIGEGPVKERIMKEAQQSEANSNILFTGALPPEQIREKMEKSHIFLFTSNKLEGWGVVLNEAMNSGCAVVANRSIGAVPFLLKDGQNGFVYENNKTELLCRQVERLVLDSNLREYLGFNAYNTIAELWNPSVAVNRLLETMEALHSGKAVTNFSNGPMSKAETIRMHG